MATTAIDLNNVLNLEDVRLHEVNSVETYTKELRWFQKLGFDKLHEFLSRLEE